MIGAIIGDVIGSTFEFWPPASKDFPLWNKSTSYTDDSVMTIAIGRAVLRYRKYGEDFRTACIEEMQKPGRKYPRAGYGHGIRVWLESEYPEPYNSVGNGSAMRVSACGYAAKSLDEALSLAQISAEVSHNHPEGIKGAQATAAAIYLARTGATQEEIGGYICDYFYLLNKTLDEIRPDYHFNETCHDTLFPRQSCVSLRATAMRMQFEMLCPLAVMLIQWVRSPEQLLGPTTDGIEFKTI